MKYIPFDKVVEIYNRISGHVPHNKQIATAQDYALMVLNEVMDAQTEQSEYDVYRKVQHDFYLEDARNFVADALAYERDVEPEDIDDSELDRFDYESLVREYEDKEDANVAYNDTWQSITEDAVSDYLFGMDMESED